MKVKLDDPALTADLLTALQSRVDAIVAQIAADELEVSLLGSRAPDADFAELATRVREWGKGAHVIHEGSEV